MTGFLPTFLLSCVRAVLLVINCLLLVQNVEVLVKSVPGGGPFLDHEENLRGNGEVFPLDIASGELDMHTV